MIHALLVLASESERSETPFYVIGIIFTVWAVAIGTMGLRSESFASSAAQSRLIGGVSVLLAAASMALSVYVAL